MKKQEPVKVRFLQKICRINAERADKYEKLYNELKASVELSKLNLADVSVSFCDLYKKKCMGKFCSVTPFSKNCIHLKQNEH